MVNGGKNDNESPVANVDPQLEDTLLIETRSEVAYADSKASFVLTAISVTFSVGLGIALNGTWRPSQLDSRLEVLWWVGIVAALVSIVSAVLAVWPRLGNPDLDRPMFYWGQIAKLESKHELAASLDTNPPERSERTRDQLWYLSKLVSRKYQWIRMAITAGAVAAVAFGLVVLGEV